MISIMNILFYQSIYLSSVACDIPSIIIYVDKDFAESGSPFYLHSSFLSCFVEQKPTVCMCVRMCMYPYATGWNGARAGEKHSDDEKDESRDEGEKRREE